MGSQSLTIGFAEQMLTDGEWVGLVAVSAATILVPAALIAFCWWAGLTFVRNRRVRRLSLNQCARCGYDVRSLVGTCPECGSQIASWR